jgi:hypothetical protein
MTTATFNGRPQRKQLSDQLNRLDDIIDTLADGLPEAVGDAVRTGTQAALQQLLIETLTNPDTLALLRAALAPPVTLTVAAEERKSFLARCRERCRIRSRSLRDAAARSAERLRAFVRGCRVAARGTVSGAKSVYRGWNIAWQLKKAALIGLGIGAAVAALALVSHPLAACLSGTLAATTAFALQVAFWARRTARRMIG